MKRLFILASAAIVALASCAKTEVVYNEGQQEISFKKITGVMTKDGETQDPVRFAGDMGVYADHTVDAETTPYFANIEFSGMASTNWVADPSQYYPVSGTLDFVAYSPYAETGRATYSTTAGALELTLTDNKTAQTDLLYSEKLIGKSKSSSALGLTLYHALSKIDIATTTSTGVTFVGFTLDNTVQSGTCTVSYDENGAATPSWDTEDASTYSFQSTSNTISCLVVPSAQTSITLKYYYNNMLPTGFADLNDTEKAEAIEAVTLTHEVDLSTGTWAAGKSYTYNINITPDQIMFTPSVKNWEPTDSQTVPTTSAQ